MGGGSGGGGGKGSEKRKRGINCQVRAVYARSSATRIINAARGARLAALRPISRGSTDEFDRGK